MKMKRRRPPADPDTTQPQAFRKVSGPHKDHMRHDYAATPKPRKEQRARRKRQLREKYGTAPDSPRPTDPLEHAARHALRQQVLQEAGGQCQRCGSRFRLTLDHVVPRHLGGGHHRANLRCLCERCNKAKGCNLPGDGEFASFL